eukprot:NODE_348_length_8996_cov_0.416433.p5 type:complete len:208 gc:universal NODE_348_length_8996_cov_0.416433:717-1340(+)
MHFTLYCPSEIHHAGCEIKFIKLDHGIVHAGCSGGFTLPTSTKHNDVKLCQELKRMTMSKLKELVLKKIFNPLEFPDAQYNNILYIQTKPLNRLMSLNRILSNIPKLTLNKIDLIGIGRSDAFSGFKDVQNALSMSITVPYVPDWSQIDDTDRLELILKSNYFVKQKIDTFVFSDDLGTSRNQIVSLLKSTTSLDVPAITQMKHFKT